MHRITLTTKEGTTKQLTTFEKNIINTTIREIEGLVDQDGNPLDPIDHDRIYGLINEGKDLVLIQYYIFDKVLRPGEYYVAGNPIQYEIGHYEILN